jgi:hypothetical protein
MIPVDLVEPLRRQLHSLVHCYSIEGISFLEDDVDVIVE